MGGGGALNSDKGTNFILLGPYLKKLNQGIETSVKFEGGNRYQ